MKNQCWWRWREREWGDEKVLYSIILLKEDLDNRWITAVCRYKGNRGWQRHQERSEKNSFNEYVTCTCMSKLCSCHLLQSTLKSLGFENSENGNTDDEFIIAFKERKTPFPSSRGSVIWCRNHDAKKKPNSKSLSSVWRISYVVVKMSENYWNLMWEDEKSFVGERHSVEWRLKRKD